MTGRARNALGAWWAGPPISGDPARPIRDNVGVPPRARDQKEGTIWSGSRGRQV